MNIENVDELIAWNPPYQKEIISDGILLPETCMILFGSAKGWKSGLALHTAHCIATGKDWFGFRTTKSAVFKYQVEIPKALERERVVKYMNGDRPKSMLFKTAPYAKIDTGYGKSNLEKDIGEAKERCPDTHLVLILDPVYLLISGHISDDYDIKRLLDNLNDIKAKHHLSLILVHHSHKTRVDSSGQIIDLGSEEIMGSSYFNNWADTMVRLKLLNPYTGANKVEMSFGLVRHAKAVLPVLEIYWSRQTLHPTVTKRSDAVEDEVTTRNLKE